MSFESMLHVLHGNKVIFIVIFIYHISQHHITGTRLIIRLPQCWWNNHEWYRCMYIINQIGRPNSTKKTYIYETYYTKEHLKAKRKWMVLNLLSYCQSYLVHKDQLLEWCLNKLGSYWWGNLAIKTLHRQWQYSQMLHGLIRNSQTEWKRTCCLFVDLWPTL